MKRSLLILALVPVMMLTGCSDFDTPRPSPKSHWVNDEAKKGTQEINSYLNKGWQTVGEPNYYSALIEKANTSFGTDKYEERVSVKLYLPVGVKEKTEKND